MKGLKLMVCALCAIFLVSSCDLTNKAKGGMIGGAGGGALGALVGGLIGGGKGAAIGTAVGGVVGGGAGVLIGDKMDKAKKAAEAAKAQAQILTDAQGTQYVKATFSSGLLFQTGKYVLSPTAAQDINNFITNLKAEDTTYNIAICGFTDNQGWKGATAEQSVAKNLTLSEQRAQTVQTQIVAAGYPSARIVHVKGYGEGNPVASNATAAGQEQNRRVEVYILPSKEMIEAANAQSK